jgi:hypothetical protein
MIDKQRKSISEAGAAPKAEVNILQNKEGIVK